MTDIKKNLLLFFDRPTEPCFMQKGDDYAVFDVPDSYYPEKFKKLTSMLKNRFGSDAGLKVPVREIALPDLSLPKELSFKEQFSLFVPKHRVMAGRLIDICMGMRNLEDLQALCTYCQLHINPYMFNYCLSVALLHRPDTKGMDIPTFIESFPDKFMDPKVIQDARRVTSNAPDGPRMPITIPVNYTASDKEPEQLVAYFREDIGINLHHWHWHLVYPFEASERAIVDKDRRGELLYYMHHQIVARYNIERMCNGLGLTKPYNDFRAPIAEGYFPKMNSVVTSRTWPPRFANTTIRDLNRPIEQINIEVIEMETWRERLLYAINSQSIVLPNGNQLPLDEETGIDILGNLMEASTISLHSNYYGDIHNMGHLFIAHSHDPDNRHLEQFGVMGDPATAMRDPVFYRWHSYIDDIFDLYKSKLPPYMTDKLNFPGIRVSSASVEGPAGVDTFGTLWERSTVDLSRGLDFAPRGAVLARFTHLQHEEFYYIVEVENTSGQALTGTVRIFLAPTMDDKGQPMSFENQRKLMIELDKFSHKLNAGKNTIRRSSMDSSVTIPYERTFRNQSPRPGDATLPAAAEFNFCGCGWPHHMLVPKGTTSGYPVVLFVMVSNWNDDKVEQDLTGTCSDAASYCGIRDRKYPDRRPMGFPFDRSAPKAIGTLANFLQPNMATKNCTIKFADRTRERGEK